MDTNITKAKNHYAGSCFILATKHAKSIAIAPPIWQKLQASIIEYNVDTDALGTFTGEIARQGTALESARRKCEWSLKNLGDQVDFVLGSEGSFGPHPFIPFTACCHEILYFIDKKHDFHLHVSHLSSHTNYRMQTISSFDELLQFTKTVQFPSHALILRPDNRDITSPIFKGIDNDYKLEQAFKQSLQHATQGKVFVETDMRAQFNPSRMQVIGELAQKLADRLSELCPKCHTPGFGLIGTRKGLHCRNCDTQTDLIKEEILGCTKCDYQIIQPRADGIKVADPKYCGYCNP